MRACSYCSKLGVKVNTRVGLLSTAIPAALLVAVTSALSQSLLNRLFAFQGRRKRIARPLNDLDTFRGAATDSREI